MTAALRRHTGSAVAAVCVADASHRFVKSVCTVEGPADRVRALSPSQTLESYILGLAHPAGSTDAGVAYAETPVMVDGQVVGQICIAGSRHRDWIDEDRETLADTAAAVSTEV